MKSFTGKFELDNLITSARANFNGDLIASSFCIIKSVNRREKEGKKYAENCRQVASELRQHWSAKQREAATEKFAALRRLRRQSELCLSALFP